MKIIIVGAGLSSAVAYNLLSKHGHSIEIFETRNHIAGNCYDEDINHIKVHKYGPHAFHTDDKNIWQYVNRFAEFIPFKLYVHARLDDNKIINIPFNYRSQIITGPLSDSEIIEKIFKPYTEKHWGRAWHKIPYSIISRLSIRRKSYKASYHLDEYQGIPKYGYTNWISNIFDGATIHVGCDENDWKKYNADLIIYTGSVDAYYDYCYGILAYRSIKFDFKETDLQSHIQLNECNYNYKNTRTIDHSKWYNSNVQKTIISQEYPEDFSIYKPETLRLYPKFFQSQNIYDKYNRIKQPKTIFLGRLGTYKYLDMDDCIKQVFIKLKDI